MKTTTKRKQKKPIYKRAWFWVVIVFVLFAGMVSSGTDSDDKDTKTPDNVESISTHGETADDPRETETQSEKKPEKEPEPEPSPEPEREPESEPEAQPVEKPEPTHEPEPEPAQEPATEPAQEPVIEPEPVIDTPVEAPTDAPEEPPATGAIVIPDVEPIPAQREESAPQQEYIANTNTLKFHYPSCNSTKEMNEENKWYYTGTRDDLISLGYDPCGRCHP